MSEDPKFYRTETAVCTIENKDSTGAYVDPATGVTVSVYDPYGTAVVTDAPATKDAVGKYHYDYTSAADALLGRYVAIAKITDGSRITYKKSAFYIEALNA